MFEVFKVLVVLRLFFPGLGLVCFLCVLRFLGSCCFLYIVYVFDVFNVLCSGFGVVFFSTTLQVVDVFGMSKVFEVFKVLVVVRFFHVLVLYCFVCFLRF